MSRRLSLAIRFLMWTTILVLSSESHSAFGQRVVISDTVLNNSGTNLATLGSQNSYPSQPMGTSFTAAGTHYIDQSIFSLYSIDVQTFGGDIGRTSTPIPIPPTGGGDQIEPFPIAPGDGGVTPLPEPSTWIAAMLSLGALVYSQRRRLKKFAVRS
jgi:hypothetical protein